VSVRGAPYNIRMSNHPSLSENQRRSLQKIGVVLLYVHGSVAAGRARKDSDVDIAVLFEQAPADSVRATADIVTALSGLEAGREMDIAILNDASPLLKQGVAIRGTLLYARSADDDLRFQIQTMHEYESSRHIVRIGQEAVGANARI